MVTTNKALCHHCSFYVEGDEAVWINPVTGEATTGEHGEPYHVGCAPAQKPLVTRKVTISITAYGKSRAEELKNEIRDAMDRAFSQGFWDEIQLHPGESYQLG